MEQPQIIITFDREKNKYHLEIKGCNGREKLLAFQILKEDIEEKAGMAIEAAFMEIADRSVTLGKASMDIEEIKNILGLLP